MRKAIFAKFLAFFVIAHPAPASVEVSVQHAHTAPKRGDGHRVNVTEAFLVVGLYM